jgi:hypothetical protein
MVLVMKLIALVLMIPLHISFYDGGGFCAQDLP